MCRNGKQLPSSLGGKTLEVWKGHLPGYLGIIYTLAGFIQTSENYTTGIGDGGRTAGRPAAGTPCFTAIFGSFLYSFTDPVIPIYGSTSLIPNNVVDKYVNRNSHRALLARHLMSQTEIIDYLLFVVVGVRSVGPGNVPPPCPPVPVNRTLEQVLMQYYGHVHHGDGQVQDMYGHLRVPGGVPTTGIHHLTIVDQDGPDGQNGQNCQSPAGLMRLLLRNCQNCTEWPELPDIDQSPHGVRSGSRPLVLRLFGRAYARFGPKYQTVPNR